MLKLSPAGKNEETFYIRVETKLNLHIVVCKDYPRKMSVMIPHNFLLNGHFKVLSKSVDLTRLILMFREKDGVELISVLS